MWRAKDDITEPVITAYGQVHSAHRGCGLRLPSTAIVFFMGRGVEHLCRNYDAKELPESFPRFLNRCPVWEIAEYGVCFLDGGRGAPQACDTIETLAVLGVKDIIAVGMFGAFDERIRIGEVIAPDRAFVEEGTSLHYYESIDYSVPDKCLLELSTSRLKIDSHPIISTDAVYRQTFRKEQLWREKGAVGVDMETSVVFSVSEYLGLRAVGLLMASDIHPMHPDAARWGWHMTEDMRSDLAENGISIARLLSEEKTLPKQDPP